MNRMDDKQPEKRCGIVTTTQCTEFNNMTMGIECLERFPGHDGVLLEHDTCPADPQGFWSGCYIRLGEWRSDI